MNTTTDNTPKGEFGGTCYRTACSNTVAVFYNHSTRKYYCAACAKEINQANHTDAIRLYGHELCTRQEPPPETQSVSAQTGFVDEKYINHPIKLNRRQRRQQNRKK